MSLTIYIDIRFSREDDGRPEDSFFCNAAADIYEQLPASLRPATFDEERAFSVESLYYKAPFGVHQYWTALSPKSPFFPEMFANCPEMLEILPDKLIKKSQDWRNLACSLNISNSNIERASGFNYSKYCGL